MRAFYLSGEWPERPVLGGAELAHLRVLRLEAGERVKLLDGRGRLAFCRIVEVDRKKAVLEVEAEEFVPAPASRPVLALALSKAVRRNFFMEKAAELGAWELWLWQAERSQGKLNEAVVEACRAQLISGLKQCGSAWLPVLRMAPGLKDIARLAEAADKKLLPWEEKAGGPPVPLADLGCAGLTVYLIGPEGGFGAKEVDFFRHAAFCPVSLGERVLRCETAALLCLGLHSWAAQLKGSQAGGTWHMS